VNFCFDAGLQHLDVMTRPVPVIHAVVRNHFDKLAWAFDWNGLSRVVMAETSPAITLGER
jgi:hypothetical protein